MKGLFVVLSSFPNYFEFGTTELNSTFYHETIACVASVSVGLSAGLEHFSLFERAIFGASAKSALISVALVPIFAPPKSETSNGRKSLWKRQPRNQVFSSRSLDSTWCEMSWRHRMRSYHEISRQVVWARRKRLGTRPLSPHCRVKLIWVWHGSSATFGTGRRHAIFP